MSIKSKLTELLESMGLDDAQVEYEPTRSTRAIAVVTSPSFRGVDEHQRQAMVWGPITTAFSAEEQDQVEFVFTLTPEERFGEDAEAEAS